MSTGTVEFNRAEAEIALAVALAARIGMEPDFLVSNTPGVVAMCRLDHIDDSKVEWQEVVTEVVEQLGVGILCVANCDWLVEGDCDEEATFISFDVPSLPADYRDDHRNEIDPVDPEIPSLQHKDHSAWAA